MTLHTNLPPFHSVQNIMIELNLVLLGGLDPDITTAVDHHEPGMYVHLSSILLHLDLRKTVPTSRKTEIFLAR